MAEALRGGCLGWAEEEESSESEVSEAGVGAGGAWEDGFSGLGEVSGSGFVVAWVFSVFISLEGVADDSSSSSP